MKLTNIQIELAKDYDVSIKDLDELNDELKTLSKKYPFIARWNLGFEDQGE